MINNKTRDSVQNAKDFGLKTLSFLLSFILAVFANAQTANFTTSLPSGCSPLAVSYDATSSTGSGTLNYIWDFGNGNTSSGTDKDIVSAIYTIPGNYTVSLQVEDNNGTSTIFSDVVTVFSEPTASFSIAQPDRGCIPYEVDFTDLSTSNNSSISSWVWDFGDGNISTAQHPTHIYNNTGTYDLSLIVTDANGCQGDTSISDFMDLSSPFDLDFGLLPSNTATTTCLDNLTLQFESQETNSSGPFSYSWNFGDGTTSNQENPSKTYNSTGEFDVTLEVTDLNSQCVVSITKSDFVTIEDVSPSFGTSTNTGCVGLNVTFSNQSNVIKNGQIVTWYFGDGDSLVGNATDPNILSPNHTYSTQGVFSPSIKINTNNGECIETFELTNHIQTSIPPTLSFDANVTESCQVPVDISFNSSTNSGTSFLWNFGDGNTSNNSNPTHTYNSFGNYDVTLTTTDDIGCSTTLTQTDFITIEAPAAEFTSDIFDNAFVPTRYADDINNITGGCIPLDIMFIDLSSSPTPIISREWNFGDGNTLSSNDSTPTNTYTTAGEYQTSLTITTQDGCTATFICDSCAKAGEQPTALLDTTNYPIQMCCEIDHTFLNLTDTATVDYIWYETSTGATQGYNLDFFQLTVDYNYQDQLPVEDTNGLALDLGYYVYNNGCVDTIDLQNWGTVYQPYVEPITLVDPCIYNPVFTFDSIYINSNIDSISWSFTFSNQSSNDIFPSFTSPDTAGTHTLTVTAVDQTHKYNLVNGDSICSCTTDQDYYFPGIDQPIDFTVDTIYGCVPLNIEFTGIEGYQNYDWDFGDGKTANGRQTSSSYDTTGSFNVQLITTDIAGCFDTVVKTQFIESIGPEPAIDVDSIFGCLPLNYTLTDVGKYDAPIVDRFWVTQVGDTILNDSILNHTLTQTLTLPFLQKDGLDISLHVTDTNGCTNTANSKAFIGQPIPDFDYVQTPACYGDSITLTSIENDSTGFAPFDYEWVFSNGESSNEHPTTKYFAKGNHTIQLILTDSLGCTDTSNAQIATVSFIDLEADFVADETVATCPPFVVQFTDSSRAGRSPIVSWDWELGDGSIRTVQNPGTIYTDTSSVDVRLIVTDSLGCVDTTLKEDFIRITGVTGSFKIDNAEICDNETVTFTASSPNGTFFTWDLGDGGVAQGDTVIYDYVLSGTRFPTLVIQDSTRKCSFTYTDTISILPRPTVDLGNDLVICSGNSIVINPSLSSNLTYNWSTGSSADSITVSTAETIILEVIDPVNGCNSFDTVVTSLVPAPVITLQDTLVGCVGTEINISFEVDKALSEINWIENNTIFSNNNTADILLDENVREIDLTVIDQDECEQSAKTVVISASPPEVTDPVFDLCLGTVFNLGLTDLSDSIISSEFAWYRDSVLIDSSESITITEDDQVELVYTTDFCTISITATAVYHDYPEKEPHELVYFCIEDDGTTTITPGDYHQYYWPTTGDSTSELIVDDEGIYPVLVGNEWNCFTPDSIETKDLCGPLVFIADAFSPNDDGINDLFDIKGRSTSYFELTIFDRWGEIIYYTEDIEESWDGFYNDQEIPPGTYPYIAKYKGLPPLFNNVFKTKEGRVSVIR